MINIAFDFTEKSLYFIEKHRRIFFYWAWQRINIWLFACWVIFRTFCCLFSQNQFLWKFLSGIPSVSNSLDLDQARHFVGPNLGPNCLQKLSLNKFNRLPWWSLLTLKAPILTAADANFCGSFLDFCGKYRKAWHFMWIICQSSTHICFLFMDTIWKFHCSGDLRVNWEKVVQFLPNQEALI